MIWNLLTTDKKVDGNSKTTKNITYTNIFSVDFVSSVSKWFSRGLKSFIRKTTHPVK